MLSFLCPDNDDGSQPRLPWARLYLFAGSRKWPAVPGLPQGRTLVTCSPAPRYCSPTTPGFTGSRVSVGSCWPHLA